MHNNQSVKQNTISNILKELNSSQNNPNGPSGCPDLAKVLTNYEEQHLLKRSLKAKVESLNLRVNQLEAELKVTKDELETFKNPGIYLLFKDLDQAIKQLEANMKEKAKSKVNEIKQKKETAMQKQIARVQKKKGLDFAKAKKQHIRGKKKKN
ncbi:21372_t:CDS:2 [Cetraspora pellucida]|uniref:21372_t:CDS:1 n=1 Tax=Cetraspora pellucida TaxID=1433469 RepID=A0A9N9G397_9GLOM|nr:21372_t:CDS:2 [Cetraspora pellucida]